MITYRDLIANDHVTLKDGRAGVVSLNPSRGCLSVQVEIEGMLVEAPIADVTSIADRTWLDTPIKILALSKRDVSVLAALVESREYGVHLQIIQSHLNVSADVARGMLDGLVDRGLAYCGIRSRWQMNRLLVWRPTRMGGAVAARMSLKISKSKRRTPLSHLKMKKAAKK